MDSVCDDEDFNRAAEAEEDLYAWALRPFLPIFANVEPSLSNSSPPTLREYLQPKTYRYILFITHENLQPLPNYEIPRKLRPTGVDLSDFALLPTWRKFRPEDIQITGANYDEVYAQFPTKVLAGGTTCFLKPLEYSDRKAAIRELGVYKQIETLGLSETVQVPRLIGLVEDGHEHESRVTGILLGWVQCENRTLHCSLGAETSIELRTRWDMQVSRTLDCLHGVGIVWGDVKAANVLIDVDENAWVVDLAGDTREDGWRRVLWRRLKVIGRVYLR